MNTEHLYSPKDVKRVRELLIVEQGGKDKLTGLDLPVQQMCLDHNHVNQFVRGVLHRQINAALGKLEGVHTRYLSYWYEESLPTFLRQAANYLEREPDERYLHPAWIKKTCTEFGKLNEAGKKSVLQSLGSPEGINATERKKLFKKKILSREFTFEYLINLIDSNRKE